ncbi:MAG: F0F1 ATP synthase subunit epsilon [Microbacteriaceae bacterium]|jgi:F-type H+-transporting ATPase subunit epsilon
MAATSALTVSVVAADKEVWSGQASIVIAKTTEGEIGILPGHEPMLALLAQGEIEVRITPIDGPKVSVSADNGFLSVENNNVAIVAALAELAS